MLVALQRRLVSCALYDGLRIYYTCRLTQRQETIANAIGTARIKTYAYNMAAVVIRRTAPVIKPRTRQIPFEETRRATK